MSDAAYTTRNSLIMLVDHQTGTVDWVKSLPKETVIASCRVLARMAVAYDMPLVLTTTMEQQVGPTIPEIQAVAPDAFAARHARGGALDCWDDAALRESVAQIGRRKIIMAGLTTDICLYWAATRALKLGYQVLVVADACGTMSALGDTVTYDRLRLAGAEVTVVNQAVTELANDFGVPDGQKAQQIMAEEIISKL
jgi:nicotinamidase-related amidase